MMVRLGLFWQYAEKLVYRFAFLLLMSFLTLQCIFFFSLDLTFALVIFKLTINA